MLTILLIIVLTSVNAIFAASEMALVSIKPSMLYQMKQNNMKNANILEKVTKDSTKYLSTIQVAITFSGFLSSAFAGSQLAGDLVTLLEKINITLPNGVAVIIITVLLSFFTLVFGELVPKRVALSKSTSIALMCAPLIFVVMKIFTPFVWLLTVSTRGVVSIFGIRQKESNDTITEKEIREMIVYGHIEGLFQEQEKNMLERIFVFDDLVVEKVMTPYKHVTKFDINDINEENINNIISSKFSRIPIYNQDINDIVGVILVKDILEDIYLTKDFIFDMKSLMREPLFISNKTKINEVFRLMKKQTQHIAFVVENDIVIGIVTLEDIIEEILGDIKDEHDK